MFLRSSFIEHLLISFEISCIEEEEEEGEGMSVTAR
jgi:hypothetical protein